MSPKFQYLTAFRMSTAVGARAIQFATPPRISLWSSTTALTAFLLGATLPLVALEPFLATNMDGINQKRYDSGRDETVASITRTEASRLLLVGSLTEMMKIVLSKDQQALFRVNAFRMGNQVDVASQSYLQLLIAEADHQSSTSKTTTAPAVESQGAGAGR